MVCSVMRLMHLSSQSPGALQIGGSVDLDADETGFDQADRDAHAGFERAQLLEPFALFEYPPRQGDKPLERSAPVGVEADMLVMRPLSPRHDRLAEIERPRRLVRVDKAGHDLVD